ncbi:MAG: Terminase [Gemmatimonadetes bacterium]|nr:Terminase [Gemmatimonadota bacterium]
MTPVATAKAPSAKKRRPRSGKAGQHRDSGPPTDGWWGNGAAPWIRWPGVTIPLEGVWAGERWESPCGRYYFDQAAADKAYDFFPVFLVHHIGDFAGKPFVPMLYQELLLTRPIFGWKRVDSGVRRFQRVFAFLPKGAGKSPWGAGTGLYLTLCDGEAAAEVYAVAGDTKQARVVHDNARIMVEESPDLLEMCEVLRDAIYHPGSRSTYKVLSSDASTKHGFRPHGIIFDEIHNQKDRNLFEALTKSMKKRRQPLLLIITHAGEDDEGIAYEEYEYAKRVLSGTVDDPTTLPVVFEASNDDDWASEDVWRKVNPGHGITVQHEAIAAECERAKAEPRKLNDFLRYTLNRWVNAASAWMPVDWWDACESPVSDAQLRDLSVAGGLDMAQKNDLAALVLTFKMPLGDTGPSVEVVGTNEFGEAVKRSISLNYEIITVPFFWIPEATMRAHEKNDRVPYSEWERQGLLRATEGNVIDYDQIFYDISGVNRSPDQRTLSEPKGGFIVNRFPRLKGAEIGYDPAFATDIALALQTAGFRMVEVLQNYKYMSEPAYTFEALVQGKRVRHDGNRVLRWNVENCAVKKDDAGRIRPVKPKRASRRIDGVVGSLMGLSRLMVEPDAPPPPSISFLSFGR